MSERTAGSEIRELDVVVLSRSIEQLGLEAGTRGTVVLVHSGGAEFEVEFLNANGNTLAVVTLGSQEVEPVTKP